MSVTIHNLRTEYPVHEWDFRCDRRSPLGNPFKGSRDEVCDKFHDWFSKQIITNQKSEAYLYLRDILAAYSKYGKVRLFCWCAPERCHTKTIKAFIEGLTTEGDVMAKVKKELKLVGIRENGLVAKTHEAGDVVAFVNAQPGVEYPGRSSKIKVIPAEDHVEVTTSKGVYELPKHPSQNLYTGKCGDVKVHVSLKKVVGTVRWWA